MTERRHSQGYLGAELAEFCQSLRVGSLGADITESRQSQGYLELKRLSPHQSQGHLEAEMTGSRQSQGYDKLKWLVPGGLVL